MSEQIKSVEDRVVPEFLRNDVKVQEEKTDVVVTDVVVTNVPTRYYTHNPVEYKRPDVKPRRNVRLKLTFPDYMGRDSFLRYLKRGDVVGIKPWHLGPCQAIGVVVKVSDGSIYVDGKRFDRSNGFSADGRRMMITPLTEKNVTNALLHCRDRLGI